jgi:dolichyl-diphosphooligosaccharide--protein glycosyltransferase
VKTFERVPGAKIRGSNAPPDSTVTAIAQFRVPTTNETFQYRQQAETNADGEFTMILPYATTGYDEYGPENGYTNVSVRSTTDHYTLRGPSTVNSSGYIVQFGANLTVPEGKVNGAEAGAIDVELDRRAQRIQLQQSDGNESSGSGSGDGGESIAPLPDEVTDGAGGTDAGTPAVGGPARLPDAGASQRVEPIGLAA